MIMSNDDHAKILWGYEHSSANSSQRVGVYTDFGQVVNPHMMITGDTGSGKTHTIRHAITETAQSSPRPIRFHVFDVHGDIRIADDLCSMIEFSAQSPYGFNPLKVNPDPKFGGVTRAIQDFINTLKLSPTQSRNLGPKQADVLRNLLLDVYTAAGFEQGNPSTWTESNERPAAPLLPGRIYVDIPIAENNLAKAIAEQDAVDLRFDGATKCWHVNTYEGGITRWPLKKWGRVCPTLSTLVAYATRRRQMAFTGLGEHESALLEKVHSKARAVSKQLQNRAKARNNHGSASDEDDKAAEDLAKAKDAFLDGFKKYVDHMELGSALEDLLKYDSFDSLSTVKQIIDTLANSDIFKDTPPRFDPSKQVWRYKIDAIKFEYQKFMMDVRLREIFDHAKQLGETPYLREVIVIDEGANFVEKDSEHIINVIAVQARKYGLAIWFASQSPTQYPDSLLTSMATKVILGVDPNFWPAAQRQLRIEPETMSWIRPRESLIVNRKLQGQSVQKWVKVISPSRVPGAQQHSAPAPRPAAPYQQQRSVAPAEHRAPPSAMEDDVFGAVADLPLRRAR
ncbi:helicase HerA domain-containing protein [Paracidovorax wautersii]|uniref:AAA-like domain-containing protein n=1 Tax=Paracidovorax wautersii TaxID=1177982 RepID=A0A1I2HS19_9BURK|nr:DUF87 domain-containing protein [Paracidovorax wautersii]SFF31181.1 AAA-like domain-containing protein [Paracidovorax wautersii]